MLEEAIQRAQKGDVEAFESVVRRTATLVRTTLALYEADPDRVNELAQETYLYVFRHLDLYRLGTDFGAYLRSIARHEALRARRARQRKVAAHRRYVEQIQAELTDHSDVQRRLDRLDDLRTRLRRCVERLPEGARNLVELRYFRALGLEEVSQRVSRSASSVGVTLFRARNALAACMERGDV
jgi:RNA polymerase sigma-70 factor (ECF subfamily)